MAIIIKFIKTHFALLALVAAGTALRIPFVNYGLPQQYQPDEWAYLTTAFKFFNLNFINHGTEYPNLFMYLAFIGYCLWFPIGLLLGHFHSFTQFYNSFYSAGNPYLDYAATSFFVVGRLVSVAAFSTLALLAGLYLKQKFSAVVGYLSIATLMLLPFEFVYSRYATTDTVLITTLIIALISIERFVRTPNRCTLILCAVLSAAACASKQPGMIIVMPLGIAIVFLSRESRVRKIRSALIATATLCISYAVFAPNMVFAANHGLLANLWGIVHNQYVTSITSNIELFQHGAQSSPFIYIRTLFSDFGPVVCMLCVIGIVIKIKRPARTDILWAACGIGYALVFQLSYEKIDRYALPVLTMLMVWLFPAGVQAVFAAVKRPLYRALVIMAIVAYPAYMVFTYYQTWYAGDTRMQSAAWLKQHYSDSTTIAREIHYTPLLPRKDGAATPIEEWCLGRYSIAQLQEKQVDLIMISSWVRSGYLPQSRTARNYASYFSSLIHRAHFAAPTVPFGFYNPEIDIFEIPR